MPIDEKGLMDAVNKGISDADPTPAPATTETSPGDTDVDTTGGDAGASPEVADGASAGAGDGNGDGVTAGASAATDGGGEAAKGAGEDGSSDPVAGGEESKEGAEGEGADKAGGPDDKVAQPPVQPVKERDYLNEPLPNALKKETKERIQWLVNEVRETAKERDALREDREVILGAIQETGATPQQYSDALSYLRMVNSPRREDRLQALQVMQSEVAAFARMLGVQVPGVNLLEGHPDLVAQVNAGQLSHEHANEIAAHRESAAYTQRFTEAQHQAQQQQTQAQAARQQGVQALNSLEAQLKQSDPQYSAKRQVLIPVLRPIMAQLPPSQWVSAFKNAYDQLPSSVVSAAPASPSTGVQGQQPGDGGGQPLRAAGRPGNQPLRAGTPAGAQAHVPKTLEEAVSLGIKEAAR